MSQTFESRCPYPTVLPDYCDEAPAMQHSVLSSPTLPCTQIKRTSSQSVALYGQFRILNVWYSSFRFLVLCLICLHLSRAGSCMLICVLAQRFPRFSSPWKFLEAGHRRNLQVTENKAFIHRGVAAATAPAPVFETDSSGEVVDGLRAGIAASSTVAVGNSAWRALCSCCQL